MKIIFNISRKLLVNILVAILLVPVFAYMFSYTIINNFGTHEKLPQTIKFRAYSKLPVSFQFFFNDPYNGQNEFSEENSVRYKIPDTQKPVTIEFKLPKYVASSSIRIDFGNKNNNIVAISDILIEEENKTSKVAVQRIAKNFYKSHDLFPPETKNKFLIYKTKGVDPFIIVDNLLPDKKRNDFIPAEITIYTWLAAIMASTLFLIFLVIITRNEKKSSYSFYKIFLVSAIWTMLILPLWGLRYNIDKDWKAEKRKLAEKKDIDKQRLFEYPANYNNYFSDNFGFRKLFIYQYNFILYKIFNQSPLPKNVILGDDNWMYYIPYPELLKVKYFTKEQLLTIKMNLEKRKKYFDEQNIKFYVMVAPEKVNIYSEHFPDFDPKRHTVQKLKQLEKYLKENSNLKAFINPTEKMLANKGKNVLFYKQDTHWNDLGAFVGYGCLMDYISRDFPEIPVLKFNDFNVVEKKNQKANISAMIGIDTTWKIGPHLEFKQSAQSFQISKYKHSEDEYSEVVIKKNKNQNLPKILVFHDSFGTFLMPYVSESFSRSVYVFTSYIDESIVAKEKPDIVLYELTEGRMNLLLKY